MLPTIATWTLMAIALGYGALCLILFLAQTRLMFKPTKPLGPQPQDYGLTAETVWLSFGPKQDDRLHGWWFPQDDGNGYTVLFCHGNHENISGNLRMVRWLRNQGFAVFIFDYRGYGQSVGPHPNEQRVYEDVRRAHGYLTAERHISPEKLVVYGHSLGGAIAIDLLTEKPAAAAIIEGSFSSMVDVAKTTAFYYGWFPLDLIVTQRFRSAAKVSQLNLPLLFIHGTEDAIVPAKVGQKLYDQAPESKTVVWVEGGDHIDLLLVAEELYGRSLQKFLEQIQA